MRYRKAILLVLGIAEVLTLTYAAALVARFVSVQEFGWGRVVSIELPTDMFVLLVLALAFGIGFILIFRSSEDSQQV